MNNKNRILKEYQDFTKNAETSGIKVCMLDNDCYHWKGLISGPVLSIHNARTTPSTKEDSSRSTSSSLRPTLINPPS